MASSIAARIRSLMGMGGSIALEPFPVALGGTVPESAWASWRRILGM